MARARYREWFVEVRFPGNEKLPSVAAPPGYIPEGWVVKPLGQICENFDRLRKPLIRLTRHLHVQRVTLFVLVQFLGCERNAQGGTMRAVCALVFVLVLATAAAAQVSPAAPPPEYREFTSKINGRQYALWVGLPDSYAKDVSRRYPVVYVTDGQLVFPLISSIYRALRLGNDLPDLIIVGVDSKQVDTWGALRFVNLTPTR